MPDSHITAEDINLSTDLDDKSVEQKVEILVESYNDLRENYVPIVAVRQVLLQYGIEPDTVDDVVSTIEEVDSNMWGDDDV